MNHKLGDLYIEQFNGFILHAFFGGVGLLISMLAKPKMNFHGGLLLELFLLAISSMPSPNLLDDANWFGYFSVYYLTFDGKMNVYEGFVFIFLLFSCLILSYKIFHLLSLNNSTKI